VVQDFDHLAAQQVSRRVREQAIQPHRGHARSIAAQDRRSEATVGPLSMAVSVSGRGMWMRSGLTPSVSAAISVKTVREPVP